MRVINVMCKNIWILEKICAIEEFDKIWYNRYIASINIGESNARELLR